MPTAKELYTEIKGLLRSAGHTAAVETNVLFETAIGSRYADLDPDKIIGERLEQVLRELVRRRIAGEPLQYLAGSWPFLDVDLSVGPGVLIPRPETESIALAAIELLKKVENPVVVDLCSGSGCIAIAVQRALSNARVTAVEYEKNALRYLCQNVNELAPSVLVVEADVFDYDRQLTDSAVDLIVSNPPYVTPRDYNENYAELRYEPQEAFLGGTDGLNFYRYIIKNYKEKLKPNGIMLFETGFDQTDVVEALFKQSRYREITTQTDDFGLPRMVCARR